MPDVGRELGDQDAAVEDCGQVDGGGRAGEQVAGEPAGEHRPQPGEDGAAEVGALPG
jgi:hypothetical protein